MSDGNLQEINNEIIKLTRQCEQFLEEQHQLYQNLLNMVLNIDGIIPRYPNRNTSLQQHQFSSNQCDMSMTKLRNVFQTLLDRLRSRNAMIHHFQNQITSQEQEIIRSREEAARYQSALGDATNFRFSDDDPNNTVQLVNNIQALSDKIDTLIPRRHITVNSTMMNALLNHYEIDTQVTDPKTQKTLIRAALKRYIIEIILDQTKQYVENQTNILECAINKAAKILMELMNQFASQRSGTDSVTPCAPIKIRQQVYSALGARAFNTNKEDSFLDYLKKPILDIITQFDTKKDRDRNKEVAQIIRDVKIFHFRLQAQEPVGDYRWIKSGEELNSLLMICPGIEEDTRIDFVVDVCSFPLIGSNLQDNRKRKVNYRAHVQTRDNSRTVQKIALNNRIYQ